MSSNFLNFTDVVNSINIIRISENWDSIFKPLETSLCELRKGSFMWVAHYSDIFIVIIELQTPDADLLGVSKKYFFFTVCQRGQCIKVSWCSTNSSVFKCLNH